MHAPWSHISPADTIGGILAYERMGPDQAAFIWMAISTICRRSSGVGNLGTNRCLHPGLSPVTPRRVSTHDHKSAHPRGNGAADEVNTTCDRDSEQLFWRMRLFMAHIMGAAKEDPEALDTFGVLQP